MKSLLIIALTLIASSAAAEELDFIERGQQFSTQFLVQDTETIWAAMSAEMKKGLGSESTLRDFSKQIISQAGDPGPVMTENLQESQGFQIYQQVRQFGNPGTPLVIQWAFDAKGDVGGFFVKPLPDPPSDEFEDYETNVELSLPFNGEWLVFWGGRERSQNYHVDYANQRYAYDLVVVEDGKSFSGDPAVLENYYCWSKAILAPAQGIISVAVDGFPDHVPGERDPDNPPGNHVVIDHGNDEWSLLAHMKEGSVSVSVGDEVAAGQQIGQCGNSGNTTEPHLHYHLQNADRFGRGHGLPAPFSNYRVEDELVSKGEPVKGDLISPETSP